MASFGSFLQNAGLGYGRSLLYGQDYQRGQQQLELEKQQVQMGQMKMAQLANQVQTQKAVGDFLSSEAQKDAANFTDPMQSSKMYQQASTIALQHGDFVSAQAMSELAKSKTQEAKVAAEAQEKQLQLKKETAANAAQAYSSDPSAENASALARSAVDAGIDPTTIPAPGTPKFASWANRMQLASMDAGKRAEFVEKVQENADRSAEKRREFDIRQADLQENRRQTAMLREGMAADRQERMSLARERLELDKQKLAAGGKEGVQQQRDTVLLAGAGAEAARNLRQIKQFPLGTTSGPFMNLSDHSVLDAVAKLGTNAFTPEVTQMLQTAGAGLALQVGRVETAGGQRGANESQIKQLEKQLVPTAGDQPLEQLYKVATGAELVVTRMRNQPPPRVPELKAEWDKTIKELNEYPKPEDILSVAQSPAARKKLLEVDKNYSETLEQIHRLAGTGRYASSGEASEVPLPSAAGGADPGRGSLSPPIPADIQSLISKYRSK